MEEYWPARLCDTVLAVTTVRGILSYTLDDGLSEVMLFHRKGNWFGYFKRILC